jgi:hypothetical protein
MRLTTPSLIAVGVMSIRRVNLKNFLAELKRRDVYKVAIFLMPERL